MTEDAIRIAQELLPRDLMLLRDVVLKVTDFFGRNLDLDLVMINRYLHEGLLELRLVRPDGTMTRFSKEDCKHRTIHAPFHRAEGVRVEPLEAGRYFARLAESISPATATPLADRQRPTADGPDPSQSSQTQRHPQQPTNEREPNSGDARASRRRRNWESGAGIGAQTRRARVVLKRLYGDPPRYPTEEEVSTPDLLKRFSDEYARVEGKAKPPSELGMPSRATVLREVGRQED